MRALIVIIAPACLLLTGSMGVAQRYTVYGKAGASGTYTRIGMGATSGPPLYSGSTHSTAAAPILAPPVLATVNATGYSYSAPGDFYYPASGHGNCITRLTNASSNTGNRSFASSWSDGGGNLMWSTDRSYGAVKDAGGALYYLSVSYDAKGCMQVNNPVFTANPNGGTAGGFSFSRVTRNVAYHVQKVMTGSLGSNLNQETLSGTNPVAVTTTLLFDYNHCPGVDGTLNTQGGNGNLNVSEGDRYFSTTLNFTSAPVGQNNAHWVLIWDRATNQCKTWYTGQVQTAENPANGNIWDWCAGDCSQHGSNPAPIALNTVCAQPGFGIHGNQADHDGLHIDISGQCNGASGSFNIWDIETNNIQTCNSGQTSMDCGGHNSQGYSTTWMTNRNITVRSTADMSKFTVIRPPLGIGDFHGSVLWAGAAGDTNPWLVSTMEDVVGADCTAKPYCYELDAIRRDGSVVRFSPNYHRSSSSDLSPISVMTSDGYCMIWESNWNNSLGTDLTGAPRREIFSICNLQ